MQIHDAIIGPLNHSPMMVTLMDTMVHFEYMKEDYTHSMSELDVHCSLLKLTVFVQGVQEAIFGKKMNVSHRF